MTDTLDFCDFGLYRGGNTENFSGTEWKIFVAVCGENDLVELIHSTVNVSGVSHAKLLYYLINVSSKLAV